TTYSSGPHLYARRHVGRGRAAAYGRARMQHVRADGHDGLLRARAPAIECAGGRSRTALLRAQLPAARTAQRKQSKFARAASSAACAARAAGSAAARTRIAFG